jgi:uncharacterized protein YgiM (DUF1202 family)
MKRFDARPNEQNDLPRRRRRPLTERLLPFFTDKAVAMIALLVALVLLMVLMSTASAEEAPVTKVVLVDAGSWLNVREFPKAHAEVTYRMERGEELKVYSVSESGWAKVTRAGDSGYCRVEYLCDGLPDTERIYCASADKLRVRTLPSAKASAAKKLRKGESVTVLAFLTVDDIQWARVSAGFIMADYLTAEGT